MHVRLWAAFLTLGAVVAAQPPTGRILIGTAALSGRIVDRDSRAPVAKVIVTLSSIHPSGSLITETDSQGRYEFEAVAAGDYRVLVSHPDYSRQVFGWNPSTPEPILKLSARQRRTDVDFALVRAGSMTGRVTNEHGEPVRGARIGAVLSLDGRSFRVIGGLQSATNERGEYELSNLLEGAYYISATWTPHEVPLSTTASAAEQIYFPGADDIRDALAVEVGAGQRLRNVDIVMRLTTRIRVTGHVLRSAGHGTVQAYLLSPGNSIHKVPVRDDGSFATPLVRPGRHTLVAHTESGDAREASALTIDLTAELSGMQIALAPTGAIVGRVVADDGSEVSDTLQVAGVLSDGETEIDPLRRDRVDVGPGGSFELLGVFGERVLRLINLDAAWSVARTLQGNTPVKSLTVVPGANIRDVTIVVTRR